MPLEVIHKKNRICLIMDSISWFVFLFYRLCLQPCPAWLVHFGVAPTLLVPLEEMLAMLEVEVPRLSPRASLPRDATCVKSCPIMSNRMETTTKCEVLEVCDLRFVSFTFVSIGFWMFRRFWFYHPGCQEISCCLSCLAGRVPWPQKLPRFSWLMGMLGIWRNDKEMISIDK